jgi:hypothetical protein
MIFSDHFGSYNHGGSARRRRVSHREKVARTQASNTTSGARHLWSAGGGPIDGQCDCLAAARLRARIPCQPRIVPQGTTTCGQTRPAQVRTPLRRHARSSGLLVIRPESIHVVPKPDFKWSAPSKNVVSGTYTREGRPLRKIDQQCAPNRWYAALRRIYDHSLRSYRAG